LHSTCTGIQFIVSAAARDLLSSEEPENGACVRSQIDDRDRRSVYVLGLSSMRLAQELKYCPIRHFVCSSCRVYCTIFLHFLKQRYECSGISSQWQGYKTASHKRPGGIMGFKLTLQYRPRNIGAARNCESKDPRAENRSRRWLGCHGTR